MEWRLHGVPGMKVRDLSIRAQLVLATVPGIVLAGAVSLVLYQQQYAEGTRRAAEQTLRTAGALYAEAESAATWTG